MTNNRRSDDFNDDYNKTTTYSDYELTPVVFTSLISIINHKSTWEKH